VAAIDFEVFYDYNCPFVYRASSMIALLRDSGERDLHVSWRYFSLTQVNSHEEGWTAWAAPEGQAVRGRLAFKAAEAARRQARFDAVHLALLRARHQERLDLDDLKVVERVAVDAGLDLERFREDMAKKDILDALARDHQKGVARHGVFGTPTFVFPSGAAAYVRLAEVPSREDAPRVFDRLVAVAAGEPGIVEIKRPTRPSLD
jgi:predicted DsbA family dithiol-disulfide isomerase